jgi:hypothetical protein
MNSAFTNEDACCTSSIITSVQAQGGNTAPRGTKTRRASAAHSGASPFCRQSHSSDPTALTWSSVKRVVALTTATFTPLILLPPFPRNICLQFNYRSHKFLWESPNHDCDRVEVWKSVIGEEKPAKHRLRWPAGREWVTLMIAIRLDRGQSFRLAKGVDSGSHVGQCFRPW